MGKPDSTETLTGSLELTDGDGKTTLTLDGGSGSLILGGGGSSGTLVLESSADDESIRLEADACALTLGGTQAGTISLFDSLERRTIHLDGGTGYLEIEGLAGRVHVGGRGEDGHLYLSTRGDDATVRFEATGHAGLGGHGHYGSIYLRDAEGKKRVGLYGHVGELILFAEGGREAIRMNGETGNAHFGGEGTDGDLFVQNQAGETTLHLDGEAGAIHTPNGDCAEDFEVAQHARLEPGDVVVFDGSAALERCERAYDPRVAGVVSGAGDTVPGIVLGRHRSDGRRVPVALIGRVGCKVDAAWGAIDVGDLLTTSPRPGHAMKAAEQDRAFGTVLGKALRPLAAGTGVIPVLMTLR